jgi:glutamate synthase (NADPH/NADH) large chain
MMRKCHLNTCPVGIATQDPELRTRFAGAPEHVINYLFFVAEELRALMASMGFRKLDEMVGHTEHLAIRQLNHPKAGTLDFRRVLQRPTDESYGGVPATPSWVGVTEEALVDAARISLKYREPTTMQVLLTNADRAFGARLAGEIARKHGAEGLPDGTIVVEASGTAGQSFGAFAARGMLLVLEGDANDYVGKGLSGGVLAVRPPARARFKSHENVIVGNTCLYGATSGRLYVAGCAGERFAVRNSGAEAVVEGVGDHGCEYMTGGIVVVLGPTGRNFAAGMSGGVAYVLDEDGSFASRVSKATVALEPMGAEDDEKVRSLVEEHVAHTRSARGRAVLSAWGKRRFVRVMPHEWRRVLELRRTA